MRTACLAIVIAVVYALSGCGSTDPGTTTAPTSPSSPAATPTPEATPAKTATKAQVQSTVDNARDYAVVLEQVFFGSEYPRDLAGAVKVAGELTNLSLAAGNSFGSYTFDEAEQEFRLCVQNTSGAYSTYDTRPMTTIETGKSGGCR